MTSRHESILPEKMELIDELKSKLINMKVKSNAKRQIILKKTKK